MENFRKPIYYAFLLAFPFFLNSWVQYGHGDLKKLNKQNQIQLPNKPNILWLVTEDMGHYIPPFGDSTIVTPNLSRLAKEGVRYPNFFSPSGVCAPSRAAIATGMYPSSFGANHMRTHSYTEVTGLPAYEAVPPPNVKMVSEWLRQAGYYCTNNVKGDYQFNAPVTAWDQYSWYAHWRNRAEEQPFFSVMNFNQTHESCLFEPYAFRREEQRHYHAGDTTYTIYRERSESDVINHLLKEHEFKIPPYLPNTDIVRRDMWKLYNNIAEMDRQVGAILKQLEEDGLLENTIIFFYGDHGGPLPREKRLIYDSGLRTPLIIRYPNKQGAGEVDQQLLSFVDLAPTLLSMAGVRPKEYMQGNAFLGKFKQKEERAYIHAAADRFDAYTDVIRAVRDKQFKYIRNYRPNQGYYLPITYREQIPSMQELLRLKEAGELSPEQAQWFRETKEPEELFDCINDPYELNNLAKNQDYQEKLVELRAEMDRWLTSIGDQPNLPERELIGHLWKGSDKKPVTDNPELTVADGKLTISCETEGASIGYQMVKAGEKVPESWQVYLKPIPIVEGSKVMIKAHRIGFEPSETIEYPIEQ